MPSIRLGRQWLILFVIVSTFALMLAATWHYGSLAVYAGHGLIAGPRTMHGRVHNVTVSSGKSTERYIQLDGQPEKYITWTSTWSIAIQEGQELQCVYGPWAHYAFSGREKRGCFSG